MTRCSKSAHLAAQNCVVAVRSSPAKESRCFWMQEMKHETKADLGGEHQLWQLAGGFSELKLLAMAVTPGTRMQQVVSTRGLY
jgi:hypothetical protein